MSAVQDEIATPPRAPRQETRRTVHGVELVDHYAWLRDPDWRAAMRDPGKLDPAIREYLEAENAYTGAVMADTRESQRELVAEMRARIPERDAGVPTPDGEWAYYARFREGGEHPVFCRRPTTAAPDAGGNPAEDEHEQILLDGDIEAEGETYFHLAAVVHSRDHRYLAYAVDTTGAEFFDLHVRDLTTGEEVQPPVSSTAGGVCWSADSRTLFYVELDDSHRPCRVRRLPLGASPGAAELVYEEPDPGFFVGLSETHSGAYLLIDAHDHETSEVRLLDAHDPRAAPRVVAARDPGVEYDVEHDAEGDRLIILTNADAAEDFKLVTAPLATPGRDHWRDLVPHESGRLILGMVEYAGHRVRLERVDAQPRIVITDKTGGDEHAIAFESDAYALGLSPGYEYDTTTLRYTYASPADPDATYDYDINSRERVLRKRHEIPGGHDPENYRVERRFARTADGESVPITLLYHRDTRLNADTPCLLYGYGAYGITQAAGFSGNRLSLVERGFVFAVAHVRGGMERGYRWYREGKGRHKNNSFDDYLAAAEHLIEAGYTGAGRIAVFGGSAGGLLVGAVLNRRPELFGAAMAAVPFVDVLNTMLDPELPLTPPEWPEWGNPIEDPEAFETIRGYCPYQNVAARNYPHLLVIAGVSDPRVTYWEPAKWVAALRAVKTDDNLLLLKTHMAAGHGGVSGRFAALDETALIYAFLLKALPRRPQSTSTQASTTAADSDSSNAEIASS
jgi:oligopeptidase B